MIKLNLLARYGIVVTCILLVGIGMLTWFIKYPETVAVEATLTGTHTPKSLVPHVNGRIIKLFKNNNDTVLAGDLVGCMETVANWQEVLALSDNMEAICELIKHGDESKISLLMQDNFTHLGELQSSYQSFRQNYISYKAIALSGYAKKKKSLLLKDNLLINKTQTIINTQNDLQQRDLNINQANLEKSKILLDKKIISQQEYDRLTSENISKQISIPQTNTNIINSESQRNSINKEMLEIENEAVMQRALFQEAAFSFLNAIEDWKNKYLLVAPISGILSFTELLQENQQVQIGRAVANINPDNTNYYLKTTIPQHNFGKIKKGQKVILKFPSYPWQEYGSVLGEVDYVSANANDSGYFATIILPNRLKTSYIKEIAFRNGLKANAEIITEDMRLAQRFYYDILKQVKR